MWQTFLCVGFLGVEPGSSSSSQVPTSSDNSSNGATSPIYKPRLSAMRTVVGCQDGSLYLLAGTKLTQTFSAHSGPVNVISCHAEGMASGGHDGLIKVPCILLFSILSFIFLFFWFTFTLEKKKEVFFSIFHIINAHSVSNIYKCHPRYGNMLIKLGC
jgi:hypothetical protein